ncbi:TonB-dependent receptor plug domain-containing protein [Campylobacter sputorum]|uniref:TonB-dependent receptor plug domain-containing protein n=1 Tax=Campylobacter sputorum TaxID=206 RepID=UPI00068BF471|nr:TonB-dependent receptor plug domain-containing protein [Campylobacter sputorum]
MKKQSFSIIATFFLVGNVFAQDKVSLDTIDVSSSVTNNQNVDAYKVNVRNATLIKDILRDIPGVYMGGTNGYNQKIYMRGMNDRGLNVTIDGARQKGNTFHHNAELLIDPSIIKSVDVGVGVHSVVGTSGAMGGSVAFKTVNAANLLEDGDGKKIGGDDYNYLLKLSARLRDYGRLQGSYEHMEYDGNYPMKSEWSGGIDNKIGLRNLKESEYLRDTFTLNYKYNPNDYVDLDINAYYTDHNLDMTKNDKFGINAGVETFGTKVINKTKFETGSLYHTLVYGTKYYTSDMFIGWNTIRLLV